MTKATYEQIVELLNTRRTFRQSQRGGHISDDHINGAIAEIEHVLGRLTAHKLGIRHIEAAD